MNRSVNSIEWKRLCAAQVESDALPLNQRGLEQRFTVETRQTQNRKGCLYIKRLSDINESVLNERIENSIGNIRKK